MKGRQILGVATTAVLLATLVPVGVSRLRATPPSHRAPPTERPMDELAQPSVTDQRGPAIRGLILDANGDRVRGATVRLMSADRPYRVYQETKTARDGAFVFVQVVPPVARVVAEHGEDGVVTSAMLRISEEQTIELTLVLSTASAVRGIVVDAHNAPIANAVVSVEGVPWTVSATSDAAGSFRLATAPDEATQIVAVARGFKTARASLSGRTETNEFVVRMVLSAADPVDGEVLDDDGNPVVARVVACEDGPSEATTQSAADGSFQLPPSAIGCDAIAEQAEFAPSDPVPVVEGGHLALRLKTGAAIAGVIVDERGRGLSPVRIGIESFVPSRGKDFDHGGARTFDDPRGAFRWDKLAPGTYVLTASAAGRPPARSPSIAVQSGVVTSGVRIVLAQGGTLEGTVTDPAGTPLAAVDLRFDRVSRVLDSEAVASTDRDGHYRLEGAPAGPLTVKAHKDGFRVQLISGVRVDSGATHRQDFVLAPLNGGPGIELGGIGAVLTQKPDGIALQSVSPGNPAALAGLRAGDRIVSIDGDSTEGMSIVDALQRLRGRPGTTVGLSVQRAETGDFLERTIVRATVLY